jgi:hypothetical protein
MASATDDAALGAGLALADGDLLFLDGDLASVSGRDNFGQAMQVIVGTPFASDIFNVTYGLDVGAIFSVAGSVSSVKDVIRLNLVKSLSTDNRVQQIQQILFDDEAGFASLAPEFAGGDPGALARRARVWHAVVALTTVTGAQQQIVISGPTP